MQVFLNPQVQTPSDAITAVGSAGSAQLDAKTALRPSFDALLDVVSTASASSATALNQHEQHAASGAAGAEFGIFDDSGRADRAQQLRDERAKHDMDSASDMRDATQAQMQSEPVRRASFDRSSTEPALQRSVAKQAAESWMDKPATEMLTQRAEESTTLQATLSSGSRHVSDSTASQSQHIAVAPGQIQTSSQPVSIANMQSHVAASASAVKPVEANSGGAGAQHSNGSTGSSGHHSLSTSSQLTNKAMFQLKSAGASKSAASPEQADRMTAQVKGALGQMLKGRGGNVMIQLTPETLGTVKVQLQLHHGSAKATIETSTQHAYDALTQTVDQLKQSLEERNVRVESIEVRLVSSGEKHAVSEPTAQQNTQQDVDARHGNTDGQFQDQNHTNGNGRGRTQQQFSASELIEPETGPAFAFEPEQFVSAHTVRDDMGQVRLALDALA